jgi:uncharacterized membrane protein YcaP (DUF421 family)
MSDHQREFITAIIKIIFTIIFGGMVGGRLFDLELSWIHYLVAVFFLSLLFVFGLVLQKEKM